MEETHIKKLLIVDDEEEITTYVKDFFEERGYMAFTALTVEEAQKIIKDEKPHLALIDILMKADRDGIELLRWIKKGNFKVKTIMLTAVERRDVIDEALRLGADDYFTKPVDLEHLERTVSENINALTNL